MNFSDELGCEQLVNFFVNHRVAFRVEPLAFLNDRFMYGSDIEPVDND